MFSADELESKLWGGFSLYALPALEQLKQAPATTSKEREKAVWRLIRWHYYKKDYLQAIANIQFLEKLHGTLKKNYIVAKLLCFIRLKRFHEARIIVNRELRYHYLKSVIMTFFNKFKLYQFNYWFINALMGFMEEDQNLYLLKSTIMRNITLERGGGQYEADKLQLEWLNKLFIRSGLAPLRQKYESASLGLHNITSKAAPFNQQQNEKVSVIVPAYNAGRTINIALDSLLAQTWKNLEIIVVDDCSTDNTSEIVEHYAMKDPRISLVRKTVNEGAYEARNTGLQYATGDLIMAHDSDDWSHPQKIELQLSTMAKNSNCVAVMSYWLRINENLEIAGPWTVKKDLADIDLSSLMIKKNVIDELGNWDNVSVSGDSEYRFRIMKYYGQDSVVIIPPCYIMSLSLARPDSLSFSGSTNIKSLQFGLRWQYKDSYSYWHEKETFRLNPRLDNGRKPFPVPIGNIVNKKDVHKYDFVVISDFAMAGGALISTLNYIIAASMTGKKVAVFHWRRYDLHAQARLNFRLYDICTQYGVDILTPGDRIETEAVIFGYPAILQYMIDATPEIKTRYLIININQFASRLINGGDAQYDPLIVRNHLKSLFGQEGHWVPNSPLVLRLMRQDVRYPEPFPDPWYPMIDTKSWCKYPLRWRGHEHRYPVVGRHSRDHYTKWPTVVSSLNDAYGVGKNWDVRLLGGAKYALKILGVQPVNWNIIKFDGMDVRDFLHGLDFYVHYPHEEYIEEFGRGIMEAMAVGIPVILPPQFNEIYGNAALYAEPANVASIIEELWSAQDKYLEQAHYGREYVLKNCSFVTFDERVAEMTATQVQS